MALHRRRPGAGAGSPLIPAGTDATPGVKVPPAEPKRLSTFSDRIWKSRERNRGRGASLKSAMGKPARTATAGAGVGPRRFGPAYSSGGSLFSLLGENAARREWLRFGGSGICLGACRPPLRDRRPGNRPGVGARRYRRGSGCGRPQRGDDGSHGRRGRSSTRSTCRRIRLWRYSSTTSRASCFSR